MKIRIHRSASQIGGNCIEVEALGKKILLDLGRPLDAAQASSGFLPEVAGLREPNRDLLGILISHPHLDHYGLLRVLRQDVPVYLGAAAHRLIESSNWFSSSPTHISPRGFLAHRRTLQLGPFSVTAFLNDHSAFDAYSLLIEADGKRVFYTGDIRANGPKASHFEQLCARPPGPVDVLLMEGTHVRARNEDATRSAADERDVERQCLRLIRNTEGPVLFAAAGQNLDRMVSLYRATVRAGRTFVIDHYGAAMARAAGQGSIPQPGHPALRVLVPQRDRVKAKRERTFSRFDWLSRTRVFPDELRRCRNRSVIAVRASNLSELIEADCLSPAAHLIWSMWEGYWHGPSSARLRHAFESRGVAMTSIHASGHASVRDLQRLVAAFPDARVVPIHTSAPDLFSDLFPRVERHSDGETWVA